MLTSELLFLGQVLGGSHSVTNPVMVYVVLLHQGVQGSSGRWIKASSVVLRELFWSDVVIKYLT